MARAHKYKEDRFAFCRHMVMTRCTALSVVPLQSSLITSIFGIWTGAYRQKQDVHAFANLICAIITVGL